MAGWDLYCTDLMTSYPQIAHAELHLDNPRFHVDTNILPGKYVRFWCAYPGLKRTPLTTYLLKSTAC